MHVCTQRTHVRARKKTHTFLLITDRDGPCSCYVSMCLQMSSGVLCKDRSTIRSPSFLLRIGIQHHSKEHFLSPHTNEGSRFLARSHGRRCFASLFVKGKSKRSDFYDFCVRRSTQQKALHIWQTVSERRLRQSCHSTRTSKMPRKFHRESKCALHPAALSRKIWARQLCDRYDSHFAFLGA